MNLNLKNIIKLDTKNQKLISFGWFGATWKDEYLVWDEDAYEVTIHWLTKQLAVDVVHLLVKNENAFPLLPFQKVQVMVYYNYA